MKKIACCLLGLVLSCGSIVGQTGMPNPRIVKRVVLKDQTSSIPPTTLIVPKKDGLFRVSVYMVTTTDIPSNSANWVTTLYWTDDAGAWSLAQWTLPISFTFNSVTGANSVANLTVQAKAGIPMSYSVDPAGGDPTGSVYEVFITVEELM